eukprot:5301855-Pleurochrysis_carterae.AAC.1
MSYTMVLSVGTELRQAQHVGRKTFFSDDRRSVPTIIRQGERRRHGLARLRGGFDAGAQRSGVGHARRGARKPRAERERSASTQAMPMQKWETMRASNEMKCARRRLRELYVAPWSKR